VRQAEAERHPLWGGEPIRRGRPVYPRTLWNRLLFWRYTVRGITPEEYMR
jgi:hypothetical protein